MNLKDSLMALSAANGPTGREAEAVATASSLLAPFVDSVTTDQVGNLFGIRASGKFGAPRVLLDAHLDEVCLYVSGAEDGFLTFIARGIDPRILPDTEVTILCDEPLRGVITCLPPHILSEADRDKPFEADRLRIDATLTPEQAKNIPIGTPVVWASKPFAMGEDLVCGKALDDRAGFAVLLRTMELLQGKQLPCDVIVLGSVQEESTMLGAKTGAFSMMPHAAVVVDVTFGDQPDCDKLSTTPLGAGAAIGICPMLSQKLTGKLRTICDTKSLPYRLEIMTGNPGTNAAATQISREGVPSVMVSVPLRYMHTPREVVKLSDIENCAQLIAEFLLSYGEETAQ
jgi:endoglucanase